MLSSKKGFAKTLVLALCLFLVICVGTYAALYHNREHHVNEIRKEIVLSEENLVKRLIGDYNNHEITVDKAEKEELAKEADIVRWITSDVRNKEDYSKVREIEFDDWFTDNEDGTYSISVEDYARMITLFNSTAPKGRYYDTDVLKVSKSYLLIKEDKAKLNPIDSIKKAFTKGT